MNVMLVRSTAAGPTRTRPALVTALALGLAAVGVVSHAVVTGATFDQALVGLGLAAAAGLVGLFAAVDGPGVSIVRDVE